MLYDKSKFNLNYKVLREFDGIQAVTYDGLNIGDKKTKVFAYLGVPESKNGEKLPAIVLVHGGGGQAFSKWVRMWNKRGYAAIAMGTTGYYPLNENAGNDEGDGVNWKHGLFGEFDEEGYTDAPDNHGMTDCEKPVDQQWMYHAIGDVMIAHAILAADSRIDSSKIGVTGISWGGVITSLVIGFDSEFAFAIPIYGSGYLGEGLSVLDRQFKPESVRKLWLAESRFDKVNMPVMWLCWNDDTCFSIQSNSMSYNDTHLNNRKTVLSMLNHMGHSHNCGWNPAESEFFANSIVKGTKGFYDLEPVSKKYYYITEPMTYVWREKFGMKNGFMAQDWKTSDELPVNASGHYIEYKVELDGKTFVYCSPYIER